MAKRGLIWFLSIMLALTFLSRAANEALVAKVTLQPVSGGILDQSIRGAGVWAAMDSTARHAAFTGLRIAKVHVQAGDEVHPGDALYAYDTAAIQSALRTLSDKLEQYALQIKELKLSRGDAAESAQLALSQAERNVAAAQSKLTDGASDVAAAAQKAYADASFAYTSQAALRDKQLFAAQQVVAAAQAALDPADPTTQAALDEAQSTLDALSAQWDYTLAEPLRARNAAQEEWNRVQSGTYDYSAKLSAYRDALDSASRALETARFNYERAKENDSDTNANVAYQIDSVALSMKAEQEKHDELSALLAQDGVVRADVSGVITAVNAAQGGLSTEQAAVSISTEALALKLQLSKAQASALAVGDTVSLVKDGKATRETLTLRTIGIPDANGVCTAFCTGGAGGKRTLGAAQDYRIEKKTDKQRTRIPLSALREDGSGSYFVLVLGTRDTVLGTQDVALRVDVTLIDHDSQYAAVDGGLSGGDALITGCNKEIAPGDRVAVEDA